MTKSFTRPASEWAAFHFLKAQWKQERETADVNAWQDITTGGKTGIRCDFIFQALQKAILFLFF